MERVKSSSLRTYVRTIDQNSIPLLQKLETDRRLIAADFFFFFAPEKEKKESSQSVHENSILHFIVPILIRIL